MGLDANVILNIFRFMATTVHLPEPLLKRLDARARALGLSRNRLIFKTLTEAFDDADEWSPEFLAALDSALSPSAAGALDEMTTAIAARRTTKPPPSFG